MIFSMLFFLLFVVLSFMVWILAGLIKTRNRERSDYDPKNDVVRLAAYGAVALVFFLFGMNGLHNHLVGSFASLDANLIALAVVCIFECFIVAIGVKGEE